MKICRMYTGRDGDGNIIVNGTERGNLTIHSYDIVPNNYAELCSMMESNTVTVRLRNASAFEEREKFNIQFDLTHDDKQETYVLTDGGWYPLMLLPKNTLVLADKNIISRMQYRYFLGKKKNNVGLDYFDSVFLNNSGMIFDVTLFALEGNKKQPPTPSLIDEQRKIAEEIMRHALPDIELAFYPGGSKYSHKLHEMLRPLILQRMAFLQEIAPSLNRGITSRIRKELAAKVFETAKKHKLNPTDIAVVLVFLRITMKGKKTAATQVIKESQNYSLENAYNTVADLMALEIMINYINHPMRKQKGTNIAYITKDKGIAKIGALILNHTHNHSDGNTKTVTSSFPPDIFAEEVDVQQLIKEYLH